MTVDEHAMPQLARPPRRVSTVLTLRSVLGGIGTQVGCMLLGMGVGFVWGFDADAGLADLIRFSGELATVEGRTTGWRELDLQINDVTVYETSFRFDVPGGGTFTDLSYATGTFVETDALVEVEYRVSDPTSARIRGMRANPSGAWIAFVFLLPGVGVVMTLAGIRKGLDARRLMTSGQLAVGTLVAKEATNMEVNRRTVYRLTFEFTDERDVSHRVEARTHLVERLEDEARERLVYDPHNPVAAVLLDELPSRPHINPAGEFETDGFREPILALVNLVFPAAAIAVTAAYLLR